MLTLTVAHEYGDELRTVRGVLSRAKSALFRGEPGARLQRMLGIKHSVRALEVTYGRNGWHPHLHILIFHERPAAPRALKALQKRWQRVVARICPKATPDLEHGADLSPLRHGGYIAKLGLEVTSIISKTGKKGSITPWEIARRAARGGDAESERLWIDYTEGMHGAQQLVWSNGARKALGLKERDDDAEHATEKQGTPVATIDKPVWKYCSNIPGWTVELLLRARGDTPQMDCNAWIAAAAARMSGVLPNARAGPAHAHERV